MSLHELLLRALCLHVCTFCKERGMAMPFQAFETPPLSHLNATFTAGPMMCTVARAKT